MPAIASFDYAVIRIVPRVEREEFVNAGVILFCFERDFLEACVAQGSQRVLALFPGADLATIEDHLQTVPRICKGGEGSGPIGKLSQRERFHWLVAPRSTMLQVSPVHTGLCEDPRLALDELMRAMVLPTAAAEPR